jgi:hypothetical protein
MRSPEILPVPPLIEVTKVSTESPPAEDLAAASRHLRAALVMRIGGKPGPIFVLDPSRDSVLGRSGEIDIALADRLASRRHAIIRYQDGQWLLEDLESRNGTWLDGRVVQTEPLCDGSVVRIGMTELVFQVLADEPAASERSSRCVIRSGPVGQLQGDALRRSQLIDSDDGRRGAVLYQASLRLLAARSSQEVICAMLEMVIEHTAASAVGWFRIGGEASLEPVCVVPPGGQLASALAAPAIRNTVDRLVMREGHAVWLQPNPAAGVHAEISCIPLVNGDSPHAAVVAMAPCGRLRDSDFDLLVGLTTLATAAWDGHIGTGRQKTAESGLSHSSLPHDADRLSSRNTPRVHAEQDLAGLSTVEIDAAREDVNGLHGA